MGKSSASRGDQPRSPEVRRRRGVVLVVLASALLIVGVGGAISFRITPSAEIVSGVQVPTQFLTHWQQVGSASGITPAPVPRLWSGTVGAPSRLPRVSSFERIDPATRGHLALVWVFNETVGVAASSELEITFHVQYLVGALSSAAAISVFVETQAAALAGPLTFSVFWDSGHAAGVTFVNQLEVVQVCSAVGTCP
jgi:hypothetical protein